MTRLLYRSCEGEGCVVFLHDISWFFPWKKVLTLSVSHLHYFIRHFRLDARKCDAYTKAVALFEPVFSALNASGVRYVIVGGLAVVLHGHPRLTADVDLVLDLEPTAARPAMEALIRLGLKARAPVNPIAFADPRQRESWIAEKGMQVFSLFSPSNPMLSLDLFVREPMPFERLWSRAETLDLGGVAVRVASIDDLISMKRSVGRPQDLADIEALEALKRAHQRGGGA